MIQAFLDSNELKLFPDTAIGLTIENFDISDMANRKIDRTNIIQVPKAGNEAAFEFSSIPNAPTDFAYSDFDFDLIVDGIIVYENGRAFIIGDDESSYTLNITNAKNIIDLLKSITLADLYSSDSVLLESHANILNAFKEKTNGFRIDYLFPDNYNFGIETERYDHNQNSEGYICIFLDTILDKIEADYDVSFSGALLAESDFAEMRIPMVQAQLRSSVAQGTNVYIEDIIIHDSLTAWDLIKNVLQLFCGVFKVNGTDLELQKFNDLDIAAPIDWSGKLVSSSKKYSIPGTAQKNYIKHQVSEDVDVLEKGGSIDCNNLNINFEVDLISLKDKLFPYRDIASKYSEAFPVPLLTPNLPALVNSFPGLTADPTPERVKGLKDLIILVDSGTFLGGDIPTPLTIVLAWWDENPGGVWGLVPTASTFTASNDTELTDFYDPTGNYTLIETMLTDPIFYEAELNLNIVDINGFDHFKAIRIDELEGIFYVNKIIEYLATSPGTATKVELIKIS